MMLRIFVYYIKKYALCSIVLHYLNVLFTWIRYSDMKLSGLAKREKYNDVNNQQDATTFSFINLFKSALHVSGDRFAHPQDQFLTVYTAFGTMHRHFCRSEPRLRWKTSVPSQPWHRSAAVLMHCTKSCIYSQKLLLRMGESFTQNM